MSYETSISPRLIEFPARELTILQSGLQKRAAAITGEEDFHAFLDPEEFVMVAQAIVDPGADSFFHNEAQLQGAPLGNGYPTVGEYTYVRALQTLNLDTPEKTEQSWEAVFVRLEELRHLLAERVMTSSQDSAEKNRIGELSDMLAIHTALYYYLMHQEEGRVKGIPQPIAFKTTRRNGYKEKHVYADLTPQYPNWTTHMIHRFQQLTHQRPETHMDLGPVESARITFVGSKLSALAIASRFAGTDVHITLVDTNAFGRKVTAEFVRLLKAQNITVADTTEEINEALVASTSLIVHDPFVDEPFFYNDEIAKQRAEIGETQEGANGMSINLYALLQNASRMMRPGSPVIVQNTTPAIAYTEGYHQEELQACPRETRHLSIADGRGYVDRMIRAARINPEGPPLCRIEINTTFRIAGVTSGWSLHDELNSCDYIRYDKQYSRGEEPASLPSAISWPRSSQSPTALPHSKARKSRSKRKNK